MHLKNKSPFLYFTKKEKSGIFLLITITLFIIFFPDFIERRLHMSNQYNEQMMQALNLLKPVNVDSSIEKYSIGLTNEKYIDQNDHSKSHLFYFDPNELPIAQWRSFGIRASLLSTIDKYRKKGGRFYQPSDLLKIWGLDSTMANRLIPYVRIGKQAKFIQENVSNYVKPYEARKQLVDINTADSFLFESLIGIGPVLAKRIVVYRNKLGGFYTINQLQEVWGLKDSVFLMIKDQLICKKEPYKKININTCTIEELLSHPYVGYSLGRALVNYRIQHGHYQMLEEIQKIVLINKEKYDKIAHYLVAAE